MRKKTTAFGVLCVSLCCYSQLCLAAELVSNTNDSGLNSLRQALTNVNTAGGGTIVFDPSLTGSTITLGSNFPPLNATVSPINISSAATGPYVCINGASAYEIFFAQTGTITMSNMTIQSARAVGGAGGTGQFQYSSCGGGGLGAGSALFVNNFASVELTNVSFFNNVSLGGSGGYGTVLGGGGAGGGGGGMNYGVSAAGGNGGAVDINTNGGGGGGGGGSTPGGLGFTAGQSSVFGIHTGGTGGTGGGGGGGGGAPGTLSFAPGGGGDGVSVFSGGGGGGGEAFAGVSAQGENEGGIGGDFGGGGGAGGCISASAQGGAGGFGGGGGGGGSEYTSFSAAQGGQGGFGGGGGGFAATSLYAGGAGSPVSGPSSSGGGGAGLGGAIFVRAQGSLVMNYAAGASGLPSPLASNTAIGGAGGDSSAQGGSAYGQDLFLNSGGSLSFGINTPVTISSAIASDPLNTGKPITIQGSSVLTFTGNNTYNGGTIIGPTGRLDVRTDANLGLAGQPLTFNNGTLGITAAGFTSSRPIYIDDRGGTIHVGTGFTASFSSAIGATDTGIGGVTIAGGGTAIFSGTNTYGGTTTINAGSSLQLLSSFSLPQGPPAPFVVNNGVLDILFSSGTCANSMTGSGQLILESNSSLILTGMNTYSGTTTIPVGSTLTIGASAALSPYSVFVNNGSLVVSNPTGIASLTAMQGSGQLFMNGTGTLLLLNNNTYSGGSQLNNGIVQISATAALGSGAVGFNGGALELLNPFTGIFGIAMTMGASGGTIQVDSGVSATASSPLAGSGPFTCTGAGVLALTGNNTYGGTTTVGASATLNIGATASLSPSSNVVDLGLLQFAFLPGGTVSNSISGNGAVTIVSGDMVFGGTNTYSGTSTINSGATLTIAAPGALSANSAVVDNGALKFDFASQSLTAAFSGAISGAGTVRVKTGTVTFNGANTYSGTTNIDTGATLISGVSSGIPVGGAVVDAGTLLFKNVSGTALPGPISGAGVVGMSGVGGAVLLANADTYSGGTQLNGGTVEISNVAALGFGPLTFNAGLLELLNPFTGPIPLNATMQSGGGTIQVDSGVSAIYSGNLTGPGPFSCTGGGTLTLSGANTYGGITTIGPNATLVVDESNSLGSAAVVDLGSLIFSLSSDTISNAISGSGSITLNGTGTFSFTNIPNTYSGGTIVSQGTLEVSNFLALGSGTISLNAGAALEVTTTASSTLPIAIGIAQATIEVDSGVNFSYSGSITSLTNSSLSLIGTGTLTFAGSNSSSGTATLGDGFHLALDGGSFVGPVAVSSGAELRGHGSVGPLTNEGQLVLHPVSFSGGVTLEVTGDYRQDSAGTLQVGIRGTGERTLLNVSQTAHLDGELVVTDSPLEAYAFDQRYKIVTAVNDIITEFATESLPAVPQLAVFYNIDPSVVLAVTSQSVLVGAHVFHHNPQQVLHNLQEIIHTPDSDLVNVISDMSSFDSEELTQALDQLHPAQFGAFDLVNVNTDGMVTKIFASHLAEECCDHLNTPCGCSNVSVWIHPFGYLLNQERIGEQLGFWANAKGVVAGLNFCSKKGLLMGVGAAFSSTDLTWHHNRGHGSMDKATVGIYADYTRNAFSIEASLSGGLDVFTAVRKIHFGDLTRHAHHQKGGYDLTAHLGSGYEIEMRKFYLQPFVDLDYFNLYQKGFTEGGADSLNLTVNGHHANMLRSEAGLSLTHSYKMGNGGCFSPKIWLSGINEAYLIKKHYIARFIGENPFYEVRTFSNPITLLSPGVDLSFTWGVGLSFSVRYSAELNHEIVTNKLDSRLEWFF